MTKPPRKRGFSEFTYSFLCRYDAVINWANLDTLRGGIMTFTFDACAHINDINDVTFVNCSCRAFGFTSATHNAFFDNFHRHKKNSLLGFSVNRGFYHDEWFAGSDKNHILNVVIIMVNLICENKKTSAIALKFLVRYSSSRLDIRMKSLKSH
jgi:hypothetical protein